MQQISQEEQALERTNGMKCLKVIVYSGMDDSFEDFGNEVEIRDWAVTGEVILRQIVLFEVGTNSGGFEGLRKDAF